VATVKSVIKKHAKQEYTIVKLRLVGGVVDFVDVPKGVKLAVVVVDYDVEGSDEKLDKDDDGEECRISVWTGDQ